VTIAIVYFGVCSIWFLWILCTVKHPSTDSTEPFRLIAAAPFAAVSALNAVFFVAFTIDGYLCRRSPPGLRRAHFAGLILAVSVLVLVQLGALYAYGPIARS